MRATVVICTYNRADGLAATIESLALQRSAEFEVVVVNGPSTDDTEALLTRYEGRVKVARCPAANLSMSRNIGIAHASGDIVAFIDDDAIPEFTWLADALRAFDDDEVAGVGGIVFDHTGMSLQYRFSAADRFGDAVFGDARFDDLCVPGGATFPYLQGTNALFRRSILELVGGFDETFDYYLDETDLCCRIVDAGYRLRQLDGAPVHHKFLPSSVRDHQRVITNWYPMVKNHAYFGMRHALVDHDEADVVDATRRFMDRCLADARFHADHGRLPPRAVEDAERAMASALVAGLTVGSSRRDHRLPRLSGPALAFQPFATTFGDDPPTPSLHVAIVSGDYPPNVTGGVARFMGDVAPALARRGHHVRVITRAPTDDEVGTVDLEDGVWVHRVPVGPAGLLPGALAHIDEFASASARELERIRGYTAIDVVYAPAWDVEALGAMRTTALPVVAMLATPISVAVTDAGAHADLRELLALEAEVFSSADAVHAISAAILDTIEQRYPGALGHGRAHVAPIGLVDRRDATPTAAPDGTGLRVLYTGRLEPRKGTDVLLAAIEAVAPTRPDVTWIVVGSDNEVTPDGSSPTRDWIAAHESAPWFDRVHLLGGVDDLALHASYAGADVVVMPSRYESFGLVAVEAMMHGKPTVSSAVGGIPEVVRDGVDGLLVAPGDPVALAGAIVRLLDDPIQRATLGANARRRFEEELSIDAAAARLEELLRDVVARRPTWTDVVTDEQVHHRDGVVLGPGATLHVAGDGRRVAAAVALASSSVVVADGRGTSQHALAAGQRLSVDSTADGSSTIEVVEGLIVVGIRRELVHSPITAGRGAETG